MKKRIFAGALLLFGGVMILRSKALSSGKLPRGIRNNNPLNIRKSGDNWQGATGDDGAFFTFESEIYGIRAAARILKTYRNKYGLNSVYEIIQRWAPPNENDTTSYVDNVASKVSIGRNESLLDGDYIELIKAMIYHENGVQPYSDSVVEQGFEMGFYS